MKAKEKKEKDAIDLVLDQIDFHGMTAEEPAGDNSGNSRNEHTPKTVITKDNETVEVRVPRDRNDTFEPVTVLKHKRRSSESSPNSS